ncbi:MAG: glycoside hydrolase family 3 N-terminal domain-containing protein [Pseudomonadota bacterium]
MEAVPAPVAALMARMTLREKIGQLMLYPAGEGPATGAGRPTALGEQVAAGAVGSIFGTKSFETVERFQRLALSTRLSIPLLFAEDVIHGHRTLFPLPIGLASTWDMDLVEACSAAAAAEAAAEGIHQAYAPMIDLCRDARWGRVAESPGEDPWLASRYAEAVVRGFQGEDPAAPGRLSACLKHFVGYGAAVGGRDYDAAEIALHTLHDDFLAPFAAGVAAGAQGIMAGFHALNGMPMHAHRALIEGWLRGEVGFEGVVVSDYTAIAELSPHGLGNQRARAVQALLAGVDLDMTDGDYAAVLPALAERGLEDPECGLSAPAEAIRAAIDAACARVLTVKHRLGLFEDPFKGARPGVQAALLPETRALARRAAAACAVLLENDGTLPLAPEQAGKVALIGPLGDDRTNMIGTWAVAGVPEAAISLREGLAAAGYDVACAEGCRLDQPDWIIDRLNFVPGTATLPTDDEATLAARAMALAEGADTAIFVLGEAKEHTGECASRLSITVPAAQVALFSTMAPTLRRAGKRVILLVLAGRPLALGDLPSMADATLYAWFAGTEMGSGIAELIAGRAEPAARLAMSLPAHPGQVPIHHGAAETGRPWPGKWQKFTTNYIDLDDAQHPARGRYPFGYGLSWTRFDVSPPRLDSDQLAGEAEAVARVTVTNAGDRPGTAVVQAYVHDPVARIQRPAQRLVGYRRLFLAPGTVGEAAFRLTRADLSYSLPQPDGSVSRVWDPGSFEIRTGLNARDTRSATLYWSA